MPTTYAIPNGATQFSVNLWTGTGATQTITNGASTSGTTFQPDFVWNKCRSNTASNVLTDSVRGVNLQLFSDSTSAEQGIAGQVTAFNSNGFTVGADANGGTNLSGRTYVGWQWKAGGAAVTNTAGSISSQVSANPMAGFSIVTYTGTGVNATVGHGLSAAPKMVIIFNRTVGFAYSHPVWNAAFVTASNTDYLYLDSTIAKGASGAANFWNSIVPSPTVISIGTDLTVNRNTNQYVAYCWNDVEGYSKFGSYVGTGVGATAPFVYLGFKPRLIMLKAITAGSSENWIFIDTARNPANVNTNQWLYPNLNVQEGATTAGSVVDVLSNGFKLRGFTGTPNTSAVTYIYAAFAENPFKYANAE